MAYRVLNKPLKYLFKVTNKGTKIMSWLLVSILIVDFEQVFELRVAEHCFSDIMPMSNSFSDSLQFPIGFLEESCWFLFHCFFIILNTYETAAIINRLVCIINIQYQFFQLFLDNLLMILALFTRPFQHSTSLTNFRAYPNKWNNLQ